MRLCRQGRILFAEPDIMRPTYSCLVDVGFLRAEGAKAIGAAPAAVQPNPGAVVDWTRSLAGNELFGQTFRRAYWYDGKFAPAHPMYRQQQVFLEAVARSDDIELRLGNVVERRNRYEVPIRSALIETARGLEIQPEILLQEFGKRWEFRKEIQQKGVDTLIALDLALCGVQSLDATAILISGDQDLLEPAHVARQYGVNVIIATPKRNSVAPQLRNLANAVINIAGDDLRRMLSVAPD